MARYSLTNESAELREQWREALSLMLAREDLAGAYAPSQTLIHIDGRPWVIQSGSWQRIDDTIYVGRPRDVTGSDSVSKADRLAILTCCAHQFGCWDEAMAAAHNAALSRILIETAASVQPLVEAAGPVVQVAFSTGRQQTAMKFEGDEVFYRYNGEPIEVDDSWTVYALPST